MKKATARVVLFWLGALCVLFWQAFALSARWSDSITETKESRATESEILLNAVLQKLERAPQISADVEFESTYFGERYFGRGRYEELSNARSNVAARRRPFESVKFLLRASLVSANFEDASQQKNGEENSLTIVCDCDALSWWKYESIEGVKKLRRINLEELWQLFQQLDDEERAVLAESGVEDFNCGLNAFPGLGGILGTLKRLKAFYEFEPQVERAELSDEEQFYKISGVAKENFWNNIRRSLQVDGKQSESDASIDPNVKANLPERVEIYFDIKDAFPRKIEYYSLDNETSNSRKRLVFSISYIPNNDRVLPEDFIYDQPQSTYERGEIQYVQELVPNARL